MEEGTIERAGTVRGAGGRGASRRAARRAPGLYLVAPAVLVTAIFTLYPFAYAAYTSVRESSPLLEARFVGLENYRDVVTSAYFLQAATTTIIFTAVAVPILVTLGVLVASLLNERFFGNTFLRAAMLLPWGIPATAAGVIWKWIFLDGSGALNAGLYASGATNEYIHWLTTPNLARMVIVVVFIWTQLPLVSILLLAALQRVPDELYDAAAVDGAHVLARFRHVTLPGIRPMLVIVAAYEVLIAFATFDLVYTLTGGGPGSATMLISYFIWSETFGQLSFGGGAALAVVIALASLFAIFVVLRAMPTDALMEEER
ncbi:MAG: carbohydrate ABC transporter permease [Streptosporangiaceae bacterium]